MKCRNCYSWRTSGCAAKANKPLRGRLELWVADELIGSRVEEAEAIIDAIGDFPGIRMPVVREGCTHYTIPFLCQLGGDAREAFCQSLESDGVPIVQGYVPPLYRLPAFAEFARFCPVAESLHEGKFFYIENCQWTFNKASIMKIGDAFRRAAERLNA